MTRKHDLAPGLVVAAMAALALTAAACSSTPAASTTSTTTTTSTTPSITMSSTTLATTTATAATTSTTSTTPSTRTATTGPNGGVIPADFQPASFTSVSLDEWWLLGTARCLSGSGTCDAIIRTTDGGSSFVGIPSPPVSATDVTQLRFANALDGYAFDPELWATTNGGTSWTKIATTGEVTELEAADGEAYVLTCATSSASCQSVELLSSQVGTRDWQKVSTPTPVEYHAQFALSGEDLYLLAGGENDVLLYSADKGASFATRASPCHPSLDCSVTPAADGTPTLWSAAATGTEAGAWVSDNGGQTWHTASPLMAGFPNSLGLAAASSSVALAWPGQQTSGELPAAMDRTANGGKSYSTVLSSAWIVLWAGFSDPARAYAIVAAMDTGARGPTRLAESINGGVTWHQVVIKS